MEKVFCDEKTGGGDFMSRPGMVKLLQHLDENVHEQYIVIFDDLKRFARDTLFHLMLRKEMLRYSATPKCLNYNFDDSPEGEFVETLFAAQGELERKQGRRQTLQKMKARIERGFDVFPCARGYKYLKLKGGGSILVRNEPLASIIAEGLEGYASGRFQLQAELTRWFQQQPEFPKPPTGIVRDQETKRILTRVVYAGMIEYDEWGISLRKGNHEPLISFETYRKIQERLNSGAHAPARKDLNVDFPLRGSVVCGDCGTPLTACWSTAKSKKRHPYYLCPKKRGCASYGKSIRRDVIEEDFATLLRSLTPNPALLECASRMFKALWNRRLEASTERARSLKSELVKIDRQVEHLVDKLVEAQSSTVVAAIEKRINMLEAEKLAVSEKIARGSLPIRSFEESVRTALAFVASPSKYWTSAHFETKRTVLKLAFCERLVYFRNSGFRTPNITLPFKALASFPARENEMVRWRESQK